MCNDYTIEFLQKTFLTHAEMSDEHRRFSIEQFKQHYPDQELPNHFKDEFNLSRALFSMCEEIRFLKLLVNK